MDAEWLSDVAAKLLETIKENKNDYAKAADAANVLARIDNRLAVPFLMKALEANPMMDSIVIPAIERIGDKEAVRFLISLLEKNDSSSSRYELVRPALVRLEKRSAPEEVEVIRIALVRFPAP
jgi:HEAT repeat protein